MGCNCGKSKVAQAYTYVAPDGKTTTYPNEVQARAAVQRGGGKYMKTTG